MERAIEEGRNAVAASQWGDAWRALSPLDPDALDIDDLDRAATAAYLTGRDEEGFSLWTRAHQRCVAEGSLHRGAAFGARLAQALAFKGDWSRCGGWTERVANLLDEAGIECVEQGYLEFGLGMGRVFGAGDLAGAHALFVQAGKTAVRFHDRQLAAMARIGEGRMDIYLGDVAHGLTMLDLAAVAVEAGELSPVARGEAYCTLIDAVWELSDLVRCRDWTARFSRWCDAQQELVLYHGNCLLHRAAMMREIGDWPAALVEARGACARLAQPVNMLTLGGALATEGDIHRVLGNFAEAETAFQQANEQGCQPQPGLALLRLAQGRVDVASAMMRRVLAESQDPVSRSNHLPAAVEIALAAGDVDGARAAAVELGGIATELGMPLLRARSRRAHAAVLLADGDAAAALPELRAAFTTCIGIGARYEAARIRLLLADACRSVGDIETAHVEEATARAALASFLGADKAMASVAPDGLTDREAEVLRLLAQGLTNRVMAGQLFISEKTVASHVSHIFTKIGVTSRAAATAYAYERGLTN